MNSCSMRARATSSVAPAPSTNGPWPAAVAVAAITAISAIAGTNPLNRCRSTQNISGGSSRKVIDRLACMKMSQALAATSASVASSSSRRFGGPSMRCPSIRVITVNAPKITMPSACEASQVSNRMAKECGRGTSAWRVAAATSADSTHANSTPRPPTRSVRLMFASWPTSATRGATMRAASQASSTLHRLRTTGRGPRPLRGRFASRNASSAQAR